MTRLPDLQRELVAAAARLDAADGAATTERRPGARAARGAASPPTAARRADPHAASLALLALAAIGVAATGLLGPGADVPPRSGKAPTPKTRFGVPTGTVAAPIVVARPRRRPAGLGPAHVHDHARLRVPAARARAGRQAGAGRPRRRVRGRRPLPRARPAGARPGRVRRRSTRAATASWPSTTRRCPAPAMASCLPPSMVPAFGGRVPPKARACDRTGMRTVDYGLLGPRATSITYRLPRAAQRTVAVRRGTDGAFLIVTPRRSARAGSRHGRGQMPARRLMIAPTPQRGRSRPSPTTTARPARSEHRIAAAAAAARPRARSRSRRASRRGRRSPRRSPRGSRATTSGRSRCTSRSGRVAARRRAPRTG